MKYNGKIFLILFVFFFTLAVSRVIPSYSQDYKSKPPERKPMPPKKTQTVVVTREAIAKEMPAHNLSLKRLIGEAKEKIDVINEKMNNQKTEKEIREHFEKGITLYKQGNLEEAKKEMDQVVKLSNNRKFQAYMRKADKLRRGEQAAWEREAGKQQKELERELLAEEKAKKKTEREAKRAEKWEQRELERQKRAEEKARKKAEREAKRAEKKKQRELERQKRAEEKAKKKALRKKKSGTAKSS